MQTCACGPLLPPSWIASLSLFTASPTSLVCGESFAEKKTLGSQEMAVLYHTDITCMEKLSK